MHRQGVLELPVVLPDGSKTLMQTGGPARWRRTRRRVDERQEGATESVLDSLAKARRKASIQRDEPIIHIAHADADTRSIKGCQQYCGSSTSGHHRANEPLRWFRFLDQKAARGHVYQIFVQQDSHRIATAFDGDPAPPTIFRGFTTTNA
jgi:hypothetical protein